MCELIYLDQIREAVADKKAEAAAAEVEMEELMSDAKASMKRMSERTAKLMLDLAFNKITHMPDDAARERLIRYAGELLRKAKDDHESKMDFFETLKDHLEEHIGDD